MNEEQKPLEPIFRVVRGQTLREMSKAQLAQLHAQCLADLPAELDVLHNRAHHAMVAELDFIEAELWSRD